MGNVGGFAIGVYESLYEYVFGQNLPQPGQVANPYGSNYAGFSFWLLDTAIKAPTSVNYTPAPEVGLDGTASSVVRGFATLVWSYTIMRPDMWQYFYRVYQRSMNVQTGLQYTVLLQYPDPLGSGTLIRNLARMDPPTCSDRNQAVFQNVQFKFTYIGNAVLQPGVLVFVV